MKKLSISKRIKNLKEVIEYNKNRHSDISDVIVNVNIDGNTNLFNEFSPDEDKSINPEIINYMEEKAYEIPLKKHLIFNFKGKEIGEEDKYKIRSAIKSRYCFKLSDKYSDLKSNLATSIILFMLGVLIIGLYFYLSLTLENPLFLEILTIVGSFSIWESVDYFVLQRSSIKREILDILQLLESDVIFNDKE